MKRMHIEKFLEKHGIMHSVRVEFTLQGYTVWSYRRNADGAYILAPGRKDPVMDVQFYPYEDSESLVW